MPNRLHRLYDEHGQSPWLDHIHRDLMASGGLHARVDEGIRGVTANPSIFEKAITQSAAYNPAIRDLVQDGATAPEISDALMVEDIRLAADVLRSIYEQSSGVDGRVSIEVGPAFAHDTQGTIAEARRLQQAVDRPNIFIKVPATPAGIPAIRQLLAEGVDVNITLIFSVDVYKRVTAAYLDALEERAARSLPLDHLASVASFFVSRVDMAVDAQLSRMIAAERDEPRRARLQRLLGRAAIANAVIAYDHFQTTFGGERFRRLRELGARVQRPLWASTGSKNPAYRDVMYVERLIGPDTVSTMPPQTIEAFLDHGRVERTIDADLANARATIEALASVGIPLDDVTDALLDDGVRQFVDAFDRLEAAIRHKRETFLGDSEQQPILTASRVERTP
jgi:transaldolase